VGKPKTERLRDELLARILAGTWTDGSFVPSEHSLEAEFNLSRVTVRRALDDLKRDRIVTSTQGSGTRVTLRREPYGGLLDLVVVAAPVYESFFANFLQHFRKIAAAHGTTVVFTQEIENYSLDSPHFYLPFLTRNIRDFVVWPRCGVHNPEVIARVRGVGANLVLFDHGLFTQAADCVTLDNVHAVRMLCEALARRGCRRMHFFGWRHEPLSANSEREFAFLRANVPAVKTVSHVPRQAVVPLELGHQIQALMRSPNPPDAFVCVSQDMGVALCTVLPHICREPIPVAVIDEMPPGFENIPLYSVPQPMHDLATQTYVCLQQQNTCGRVKRDARKWQAQRYTLRGRLCANMSDERFDAGPPIMPLMTSEGP
jgi:DNA-binding LacI/PurR family transcriptional regulator